MSELMTTTRRRKADGEAIESVIEKTRTLIGPPTSRDKATSPFDEDPETEIPGNHSISGVIEIEVEEHRLKLNPTGIDRIDYAAADESKELLDGIFASRPRRSFIAYIVANLEDSKDVKVRLNASVGQVLPKLGFLTR